MACSMECQKNDAQYKLCYYCKDEKQMDVKKCSQCELVYYCDEKCQKSDWKKHKTECLKPKPDNQEYEINRLIIIKTRRLLIDTLSNLPKKNLEKFFNYGFSSIGKLHINVSKNILNMSDSSISILFSDNVIKFINNDMRHSSKSPFSFYTIFNYPDGFFDSRTADHLRKFMQNFGYIHINSQIGSIENHLTFDMICSFNL